jgi:hypothetical protein
VGASEAERMVWQAERMDERGRLARDWHQLLALYGFLSLLFHFIWLSQLFMALYGFFNLKKPKVKSRESLLALTLQLSFSAEMMRTLKSCSNTISSTNHNNKHTQSCQRSNANTQIPRTASIVFFRYVAIAKSYFANKRAKANISHTLIFLT